MTGVNERDAPIRLLESMIAHIRRDEGVRPARDRNGQKVGTAPSADSHGPNRAREIPAVPDRGNLEGGAHTSEKLT